MIAQVRKALDCLPTADRQILHLAFEEDLSCADIMKIMGKPSVSAVTSHIYRALRRLKGLLERSGYFAEEFQKRREER